MTVLDALPPQDAWLGRGLSFPLRIDAGGRLETSSGMARIRQSIQTILTSEPGERVMLPDFGCGLRRFLMAPNTRAVRTAIQQEVSQALTLWEPRIRLTGVEVTPGEQPTLVWLDISYVRLVDLRADNLVYPFYLS